MGLSWSHILIVLVLFVLLFGRGKISELMGDVAKGIKTFKKGMADEEAEPNPPTIEHDPLAPMASESAEKKAKVVGTGWTAVTIRKIDTSNAKNDQQLKAFRDKLQPVSGSWGSGRLLAGTAFSAVWTDDGRLAVGAVRPDVIYQALNK